MSNQKQNNTKKYVAPGVSVEVTFKSVPRGYIKDIPVKGVISAKAMKSAVCEVVSQRSASHQAGRSSKYFVPRERIRQGERIRISGSNTTRRHLSKQTA